MRLCPHPSQIPSNDSDEVWHEISKLTSPENVHRMLKERIDKDFFGFGQYIDKLIRAKLVYNCENPSIGEDIIEIPERLSEDIDINLNTREVRLLAKQAFELYRSSQSQSVSMYVRPIALYYSYTKLARMLFLCTYKSGKLRG